MESSTSEHEQGRMSNGNADRIPSVNATVTTIVENSTVAFIALDSEWRFAYVNRRTEELLQKSRAELLGKDVRDEFPDDVTAPFYAGYRRAFHMGTPTRFEALYTPLNIWLDVHVYPSDAGLSIFFHEVSNRGQDASADALRESEQRFRALWQASADAMALSDAQGTVLAANPAYLQLYGYTYEEVVGQNFAIIFPEHFRVIANEQYHEIFNNPHVPPTFERIIQRKDGTERVVESRIQFIEESGQRVAMLSSIRDITERVQQAEALRESEERFRKTFEGAPIGMALVGLDFKPFRVNSALCKLLGYNEQELTGMTATELTYPEDVPADLEMANRLLSGKIPSYTIEKRYLTRSGGIVWAQLSVALVRDKDDNILYALSMLEDITGRRRAEEERVKLLFQEQEARTLAERAVRAQEELLSVVSHDLRNPIAVIKSMTQLLQRRVARSSPLDTEQLIRDLAKVMDAAERMENFIDDLSTPQHLQPGQPLSITPGRVDLVALARRVAESHQQRTEQHQLVVEAHSPELIGRWDPARLEQVLDNLITNAVKYSPRGGVVRIAVGKENSPESEGVDVNSDDVEQVNGGSKRAVVTVQDEGMGIPASDLPHVFEWYHRGANVRDTIQGTGIGLAGAKQIVEQHGGSITAESREGQGATFTVLLPLDSAPKTTE
jgi:PAS domain S-box-containing protein